MGERCGGDASRAIEYEREVDNEKRCTLIVRKESKYQHLNEYKREGRDRTEEKV